MNKLVSGLIEKFYKYDIRAIGFLRVKNIYLFILQELLSRLRNSKNS